GADQPGAQRPAEQRGQAQGELGEPQNTDKSFCNNRVQEARPSVRRLPRVTKRGRDQGNPDIPLADGNWPGCCKIDCGSEPESSSGSNRGGIEPFHSFVPIE